MFGSSGLGVAVQFRFSQQGFAHIQFPVHSGADEKNPQDKPYAGYQHKTGQYQDERRRHVIPLQPIPCAAGQVLPGDGNLRPAQSAEPLMLCNLTYRRGQRLIFVVSRGFGLALFRREKADFYLYLPKIINICSLYLSY